MPHTTPGRGGVGAGGRPVLRLVTVSNERGRQVRERDLPGAAADLGAVRTKDRRLVAHGGGVPEHIGGVRVPGRQPQRPPLASAHKNRHVLLQWAGVADRLRHGQHSALEGRDRRARTICSSSANASALADTSSVPAPTTPRSRSLETTHSAGKWAAAHVDLPAAPGPASTTTHGEGRFSGSPASPVRSRVTRPAARRAAGPACALSTSPSLHRATGAATPPAALP